MYVCMHVYSRNTWERQKERSITSQEKPSVLSAVLTFVKGKEQWRSSYKNNL